MTRRFHIPKVDVIYWLRKNLFDGAFNSLLSLILISLGLLVLSKFIDLAVFHSVWNAGTFNECREIIVAKHGADARGACWAVFRGKAWLLLFGFYPPEQYLRPILAFALALAAVAPALIRSWPRKMLWFTAIYPISAYELIWGGFVLGAVESHKIGGILLVLILSVMGIVTAIPVGIALALGRQFLFFPLRVICALVMALSRGIPLIVLLFAGFILTNYVLPPGTWIDAILRIVAVMALHTGGIIAGVILDGLRTIPQGQWEASRALGFSHFKTIWLVILPQVQRNLSPWLVLASVGLIRDTSLISIVGFSDPIALVTAFRSSLDWSGAFWELFVFVGLFYWIICFPISCYSKSIEKRLKSEGHETTNLNQTVGTQSVVRLSTS